MGGCTSAEPSDSLSSSVSPIPLANTNGPVESSSHQQTHPPHPSRVQHLPNPHTLQLKDAYEIYKPMSRWSPPPTPSISENLPEEPSKSRTVNPVKYTNVLLLGESGVGKSTFINAIVNYYKFDTLEEASKGEPIAVTPVSFLMTVGDNFEEKIVRFGKTDPNEDFDHPGQSVTQQCRSYVFSVSPRTKLRIIDTPGMGDTRGSDQDELNMQHILSFINKLPHLNSICILLKPNQSKLNVVFRSYFTRLVEFLGENLANNIIFCFTNTRSTFYTPGDTAPLLREALDRSPIKGIPFGKSNTFCFDSESFRYLMAVRTGIKFDDYQKQEYTGSWVVSVNESIRLLTYIHDQLKPQLQNQWQSIDSAQFQVKQMIRPMLEASRNFLRNIILHKKESKEFIELSPSVVNQSSWVCVLCKVKPNVLNQFSILPDMVHRFNSKCSDCSCNKENHIEIYYKLDYKTIDSKDTKSQTINDLEDNLTSLKDASLEFQTLFSDRNQISTLNDPILTGLNQIIDEENKLCEENDQNIHNSKLIEKLSQFKEEYQRTLNESSGKSINLEKIFRMIHDISKMHSVEKQMECIQQYNEAYIKAQEKFLF